MYVVDSSSCAVPFTHTKGCALKGSLFALAEPHTPFLALARNQLSCQLTQVACSSKVCTVLFQSLTNPSWLVEGALVLAAVSDPTLVHLDTLPS